MSQKIIKGIKLLVILLLMLAIGLLILMQWKSAAILEKAMSLIERQMTDTLTYDDVSLEWLKYFPCAAVQMSGVRAGRPEEPFIEGGAVDIVMAMFPLLTEKIIIHKLNINGSQLNIIKLNERWSFELFKKNSPSATDKAGAAHTNDSPGWEMLIKKIDLKNVLLAYDDHGGISFNLEIDNGNIEGDLSGVLLEADIELDGVLHELKTGNFFLATPFKFESNGRYHYDPKKNYLEFDQCKIKNKGITIELNGHVQKEEKNNRIDLSASWSDADPQFIKALLPSRSIRNWNEYEISGKSKGQLEIKGLSSKTESPHISFSSELRDGALKFPGEGGMLKNLLLDMTYDNGKNKAANNSYFHVNLRNGSFEGKDLKATIMVDNLEQPLLDLDLKGSFPASMLNIFMDASVWDFYEGGFDIDHFQLSDLHVKNISFHRMLTQSSGKLSAPHLKLKYKDDEIAIYNGEARMEGSGKMKLTMTGVSWNKAHGENVEGDLSFYGDEVDFDFTGRQSKGHAEVKGRITGLGQNAIMTADWKVMGIEMNELLQSFENFDQTFITDQNLSGKADIWTHTVIPYTEDGTINAKEIRLQAAIEIDNGRLKGLKTLEDFSQYVHIGDLRDIRFNRMRNYLKIENAKVHLPVMFIQSSAINLSVNGMHGFNQEILYNLKINAGQAAANKLKKLDPLKRFKSARKSGWINLYYVLSGSVNDVRYEQDQQQVVSSFEQSGRLKEELRNFLVGKFGHDIYWIEPNEWEDIPEYK